MHDKQRESIEISFRHHGWNLITSMPRGSFMPFMEPINIIKNYYGEKYALFITFLVHHIGMLAYLCPLALTL
jgi:hypothetical protein